MRLDLLILVRLAAHKPPDARELVRQLRRVAAPAASEPEFRRSIAPHLDQLAAEGCITRKPTTITERGRERATQALGVGEMPSWVHVRDQYLPASGLGIAPDQVTGDARELILARLLGRSRSTISRLVDEAVKDELGLDGKVTLNRIRAQLLARRLGIPPRSADLDELVRRASAWAVRETSQDAKKLRPGLARRWVTEEGAIQPVAGAAAAAAAAPRKLPPTPSSAAVPEPASAPATKPWTDADIVAAVRAATVAVPAAGRFGDDKVFISALWRQLDQGAAFPGLTFAQLKDRLVVANRDRQLTLARADLVAAMDPSEVAASEIRYLNATFHFVVDRSRP